MTDRVQANAGSGGEFFAVDSGISASAGTVALVPYTKLMDGTLGSDAVITGDATNGLDVDVTRVGGTVAVSNAGLTELAAAINASSQLDVNIAASGATVPVSGTVAVSSITTSVTPGTSSAHLGKAVDTSYSAGDTGVMMITVRDDTLNARASGENKYETLHTDASGALWVDPVGNVAHDGIDSGNPVKVGGKAVSSLKTTTLVASLDRIDSIYDLDGAQMVRNHAPLGDIINESKTLSTSAATNFSTFNASSGVKNCITSITITNSHATTFGTIQLKDGSGGSAFWTLPAPASGGGHFTFDPPLKQTTANTALGLQLQPNVADVVVCVNGFQSKA